MRGTHRAIFAFWACSQSKKIAPSFEHCSNPFNVQAGPQQISRIDGNALKDISTYLMPAKFGSTALVGFFPSDPLHALQAVQHKGFVLKAQSLEHGVQKFFSKNWIRSTLRDDEGKRIQREIDGTFLLLKLSTPEAYMFLTRDGAQYLTHGLLRLLYRARVDVCRLRLTSIEMRAVVAGLLEDSPGRLVVRRSVSKNKRLETTISYETESLDELYKKAQEDDAHVHSFAFTLLDKTKQKLVLNVGLNREGKIIFYDGNFSLFWQAIVERAARIVKTKKDLLSNRSRSERSGETRPIRIAFGEPVFSRQSAVRAFLVALGKIRHGEFTIFHRNPYLHVSFLDFFDSSEFDVFVDSSDSLMIVPQYQTSLPSLFRFCQKIFENFQEGTISDDAKNFGTTSK
jgi:hypothetical protein